MGVGGGGWGVRCVSEFIRGGDEFPLRYCLSMLPTPVSKSPPSPIVVGECCSPASVPDWLFESVTCAYPAGIVGSGGASVGVAGASTALTAASTALTVMTVLTVLTALTTLVALTALSGNTAEVIGLSFGPTTREAAFGTSVNP